MKYYIIVGEASGDLHASHLMQALSDRDPDADFRFFGGDLMTGVGGTRVRHYRDLAYMGFIPVLLHLRTISKNMKMCKRDVLRWNPDALILVDYPGFNLDIAKYVHRHSDIPVYYYISPKIWAWKEYRIKNIKRDVDEMFSILPFEKDFYEKKHNYPIHYVGNPTATEVGEFRNSYEETPEQFRERHNLDERLVFFELQTVVHGTIVDHALCLAIIAIDGLYHHTIVVHGLGKHHVKTRVLVGAEVVDDPIVVCPVGEGDAVLAGVGLATPAPQPPQSKTMSLTESVISSAAVTLDVVANSSTNTFKIRFIFFLNYLHIDFHVVFQCKDSLYFAYGHIQT